MKRAVDGELCGQRPAKIVALGAAMSKFAIVVSPDSGLFEPEQLKDMLVAVTMYNGSHFTTLKMLEGFLRKDEITVTNAGTMHQRLEALRRGELAAATFNEPWISVAEKQGFRCIMESHSTRSEAAGDEMDGPTLAAMFRAEAEAAKMINATPARYAHYITDEARGLLEPHELQTWRLLYAPPAPYTQERFERTYQWMLGYPELVTQVRPMTRSSTTGRGSKSSGVEAGESSAGSASWRATFTSRAHADAGVSRRKAAALWRDECRLSRGTRWPRSTRPPMTRLHPSEAAHPSWAPPR